MKSTAINNKSIWHSKIRNYFLVSMLLCLSLFVSAQDNNMSLTVIANVKGAPAEMKMSSLKSILKGDQQRWDTGKVIIVLMKTTTMIGKVVSKRIYNMSPDEVKGFWLKYSFSGKGDNPTFCNTIEELENFINENPGAIGILDKFVDNLPSIKMVTIDGKKSF
jgi:hypothetical protein